MNEEIKKSVPGAVLVGDFTIYSVGIVAASVCTTLSIAEAVARINAEYPTTISSDWQFSEEKFFSDGEHLNGCDCPDFPGFKHYLMNC